MESIVLSLMSLIRCFRFKQAVYKLLGEYEAQDVIIAGRYVKLNSIQNMSPENRCLCLVNHLLDKV